MSVPPLPPALSAEPLEVDDDPPLLLVVFDELPHAAASDAVITAMAASKIERFT
jgi:hypothetical protein